jgi:uncharacterized protein YegP (UPF0339 family)
MMRTVLALAVASGLAAVVALPGTAAQEKPGGGQAGALTFEVFKDSRGEFRWRLRAANAKIIADSGEGYKAKADCLHGIDLVKEGAATAKTVDRSDQP